MLGRLQGIVRFRRNLALSLFTILVAVCTIPAVGQVVTGSLDGTVVDPSGAVVQGATVTLKNVGTGAVHTATTSNTGGFRFALLAVGSYDVEVSKGGFRKLKVASAAVDANVDRSLGTLALELGSETESIEVTAAPPLVEATQAQITTAVSGQALQQFAGVGEEEGLDFIALTLPGVSASRDNNFSNTNGVGFSVNGLRGRSNDQQIDGQNNNDNSVTGPQIFMADADFVNEYQATTNNFGPEYGRNSGSVINVVTKSGTNRWHGTVFGNETNSVLTALTNIEKDYEDITKPPRFNEEYAGGSIGGPFLKDKIFIFGGFDETIDSSTGIAATGLLSPTANGTGELATCFPGSTAIAALAAYGPFGVGGGNPQPLPGSTTTAYYDNAPVNNTTDPSTGSPACGYQLAGIERTLPDGFHEYNFVTRLDVNATKSDSFFIRYLFQRENFFDAAISSTNVQAGYPVNVPSIGQSGLIDWTHTFSNRFLNELRVGYGRNNVEFGTNTIGTVPGQQSIASALTSIGFISALDLPFGPASNMPQGRIVNTYQLQDNFSYTRGNHQLKWGANITNQRSPNVFLPAYNGVYSFSDWGGYAANSQFSSLPSDNGPAAVSVTLGNPAYAFHEWDTFFYGGDDWKVKSNLTLNLGLTWSYLGQPANLFHNESVAQQSSSSPFWSTALPLSVTTAPVINTAHDLFGPSIGFAWSPEWLGAGKTVVRGGYRLTYDPAFYNTFLLNAIFAPVVLAQTFIPSASTPLLPGLPAAPYGPSVRSEYSPLTPFGTLDPRAADEDITPINFRPDKVHEWSFGIQRELVKDAVAEVRYVGNHGENLYQSANVNPYVAGLAADFPSLLPSGVTPCTNTSSAAYGRVNCNIGATALQTANSGYSNYDGLQAEFRTTNLFKQLTLRSSYTWSKTLDNTSEIFNTFAAGNSESLAQNPLNVGNGEYGISGLDFPQTWTLAFVEDIPFMRSQPGLIGHVLGGWGVSGTYTLQSGQPFTPVQEYTNDVTYLAANILGLPNSAEVEDIAFNSSFNNGVPDVVRPFKGSASAPQSQVGIYAGDACLVTALFTGTFGPACAISGGPPANTLLSLNAYNAGAVTPVTPSQVRVIANGYTADQIYGTPFGNVQRGSMRDYHTNLANFTLYKTVKAWERANVQWHMTMDNVFNHGNYGNTSPGISPFLELASVPGAFTTYGVPQVTSTGDLACPAGSRCLFFGLKVIY